MEQVIFQIETRDDGDQESQSNSKDINKRNSSLTTSPLTAFNPDKNQTVPTVADDGSFTYHSSTPSTLPTTSKQNGYVDHHIENHLMHDLDDLNHVLKLSASYFEIETLEPHNEAAFYTITTQGLALCQLRENVAYRLRILYNLALYYYTKAAPQLRHLKLLEDVLELSPEQCSNKQCSIATYYNNLAFMRLGAAILETENREALQPFQTNAVNSSPNLDSVFSTTFSTTEIELLVALNQLDLAFETNEHFSKQACNNSIVQHAYYALHNYLIFQASGNHFKAKLNLEEALKAFEQTECNRSIATCHHYFSELYENLGYYTQALEHIKSASRFEAKSKATSLNLSELERLHFQFRKKIAQRRATKAQNLN